MAQFHVFSMPESYAEARNLVLPPVSKPCHLIPVISIRKAEDRGHAQLDWLDTYYSFSFADYQDPQWMGFHSLRVINDDLILPEGGFPTHPHRDMEILTYVLSGALAHRDTEGNVQTLHAGEFQYMCAGSGIEHSEFNPSSDEAAHILQIWIRPDRTGLKPRYESRSLPPTPGGLIHLIASKNGRDGSITIHQDADVYLAQLKSGSTLRHALKEQRATWVHIASGEARLNGLNLKSGDGVAIANEPRIELEATTNARVLLFDLN
jgi:redox-sensitive bicupin YhaK (pirin superfamily)